MCAMALVYADDVGILIGRVHAITNTEALVVASKETARCKC